jgi:hypothetical protein
MWVPGEVAAVHSGQKRRIAALCGQSQREISAIKAGRRVVSYARHVAQATANQFRPTG